MIVPRRSFLQSLATLPLIGGSVTLIGQPTAVAAPATPDMLEAYKTWLEMEQRFLCWDMADDPIIIERFRHMPSTETRVERSQTIGRHLSYVGQSASYHNGMKATSPYERAALVLSTVGCDWREDGR